MSNYGPKLVIPYRPLTLDMSNMPHATMSDDSESRAAHSAYLGLLGSIHTVMALPLENFEVMDLDIMKDISVVLPPVRPVISRVMLEGETEERASFISVDHNVFNTDSEISRAITEDNSSALIQGIDFDVLVVIQRLARDVGYAATLALVPEQIEESTVFRFGAY